MPQDIFLGRNIDNQRKVYIPEQVRSTHMHVIGSTGTGKSKFLELMIRGDISNNNGVCLIDPHGYLYEDLVNWLISEQRFFKHKKIVLFNPASDDYFLGFNPFIHHSLDISHQVDTMVNSCAKAWGAENMDSTPLLKKCLRCIFHALAETDLTLLESLFFISFSNEKIVLRNHLIEKIKNPIIKEVWQSFQKLSARDYGDQFSSSANRLVEFLSSERIRRIIGQRENTISFKKMMDEGYIVLVNLSGGQKLSRDNARLLGTLMINDLFLSATERKRIKNRPPKPFYLYIDECAQFLNEDIGRILDECRKFGLHLILAHQHLAQLRKAGEDIYSSVMTDAKTKVVFGGLTPDDARILAEQIFMGEFDINEIKNVIHSRKVMDYRVRWFRSKSETEGYSNTETVNWSEGRGESSGRSDAHIESSKKNQGFFSENGGVIGNTSSTSMGESSFSSTGGGYAITESKSISSGESEGLDPIFGEEVSSVQYRSLEEQLYRAMAVMVNQPPRLCLIKMPQKKVGAVKIEKVDEAAAAYHPTKDLLAIYQQKNFEKYKNEFISLKNQVDSEIDSRQASLLKTAKEEKEKKEEKKKGSIEDLRE